MLYKRFLFTGLPVIVNVVESFWNVYDLYYSNAYIY